MLDLIAQGGIFSLVIFAIGATFYTLLVAQLRGPARDRVALLWSLLASMVATAFLAMGVGLWQARGALSALTGDVLVQTLAQVLIVSTTPIAFACLLAAPGTIALGIVAGRLRRQRLELNEAG